MYKAVADLQIENGPDLLVFFQLSSAGSSDNVESCITEVLACDSLEEPKQKLKIDPFAQRGDQAEFKTSYAYSISFAGGE